MQILIVEPCTELARLWQQHLERQGAHVIHAPTAQRAVSIIATHPLDAVIVDLMLDGGSGLAIADFAQYRRPQAKVIIVSDTHFFSDGSIFSLTANVSAFLPSAVPPDDLGAIIAYHCAAA